MKTISATLIACAFGCVALSPVAQANTETVLYSFCSQSFCTDGAVPKGGLISVRGVLYGTTEEGGSVNGGTVFALTPRTDALTVLHSFTGGTDGADPQATMIDVGGVLYGTTQLEGPNSGGTVFSFNPGTDAETVLYSFKGGNDGVYPYGGLLSVGSTLYGTTPYGGGNGCSFNGCGTVYSFNRTTHTEKIVHSFQDDGTDGTGPQSNLIDVSGILFGTTGSGGPYSGGTAFMLDPMLEAEAVLYAFGVSPGGSEPVAGLINVNGTLYGTTQAGGANAGGTVFSFDLSTGIETVLYSFCSQVGCADGQTPVAGLINVGGTLYGTTEAGGAYGGGTVFSFNPGTSTEAVLHSFGAGADGANPTAGLIDVGGKLYGTTSAGAVSGKGTVFSVVL